MTEQWKPAATRGQFDLDVLTAARAKADLWMISDEGVAALLIVRPWDAPTLAIRFKTLQRVREFVNEMTPCQIRVFGVPDEDEAVAKLQAELVEGAGGAVPVVH